MSHTCTFVIENGYNVCKCCGLTDTENNHYWHKNQNLDVYIRSEMKEIKKDKKLNKNWYYLLKINKIYTSNKSHTHTEIKYILNQFPLNDKRKTNLYQYLMSKNLKSNKEVWESFYKIICILDLPITTKEYIGILKKERNRRRVFTPLTFNSNTFNTKSISVRKYYWYISKCINKAQKLLNLSHEEEQDIYKIVFNYYNLIRFRMLKSLNPIHLIQNLVYYTIRQQYQPNQQKFSKKNFGLQNLTYIAKLVNFLKEIKDMNLDSKIPTKLTINARNIKICV